MSLLERSSSEASGAPSRREFLRRAGFGLGTVAAASALQACDSTDTMDGDTVVLDFSNDAGVLNYAYALEQLEAAFYDAVITSAGFMSTFPAPEQSIFQTLAAHEAIHRDFFKAAIEGAGAIPIADLTVNFSSINFSSRDSVLGTAQVFEDLGVSAYNGAGRFIRDAAYLTLAGKIVSVEARHASVISGLISPNAIAANGQIDSNGLDKAQLPGDVIAAASGFIENEIVVQNAT